MAYICWSIGIESLRTPEALQWDCKEKGVGKREKRKMGGQREGRVEGDGERREREN